MVWNFTNPTMPEFYFTMIVIGIIIGIFKKER